MSNSKQYYKILVSGSSYGLSEVVNSLLLDGYELVGQPFVSVQGEFYQCVIRKQPIYDMVEILNEA